MAVAGLSFEDEDADADASDVGPLDLLVLLLLFFFGIVATFILTFRISLPEFSLISQKSLHPTILNGRLIGVKC